MFGGLIFNDIWTEYFKFSALLSISLVNYLFYLHFSFVGEQFLIMGSIGAVSGLIIIALYISRSERWHEEDYSKSIINKCSVVFSVWWHLLDVRKAVWIILSYPPKTLSSYSCIEIDYALTVATVDSANSISYSLNCFLSLMKFSVLYKFHYLHSIILLNSADDQFSFIHFLLMHLF